MAVFLSNHLKKYGIKAYGMSYLECGIETNDNYGEGNILTLSDDFYSKYFNEYDVLVVPGFIASNL